MTSDPTFGFSEFTTWPWSFKEDLADYKKHGASVIEICEFEVPHNDYAEYLQLIAQSGMQAASIQAKIHSVFVDSMASKPQDTPDRIDGIERSIMMAPHVPKGTPFVVITGVAPDGNFKKAIDTSVEALKNLGEFAAQHGVTIAFEPLNPVNIHTDTAVWGLDHGLALVERVNHPAVGDLHRQLEHLGNARFGTGDSAVRQAYSARAIERLENAAFHCRPVHFGRRRDSAGQNDARDSQNGVQRALDRRVAFLVPLGRFAMEIRHGRNAR